MRLIKLSLIALALPFIVNASVINEIKALEANKGIEKTTSIEQSTVVRALEVNRSFMSLPDGRQIDMQDYAIVLFMQANCKYSKDFDPMIKTWADKHNIKIYPYTLDGGGDSSFPTPLIPRKIETGAPLADEIMTFFGNGLPIATPTAFVVNVNNLKAYPLTQGQMEITALESRYAGLIQADIDNVDIRLLPPMPASNLVTPH
ncbi:F-type conjugal transfer protein TrbB [Pectobacterium brasiliense]|uniref:F-type conjugal transfer protein TrbB n=1 Tax=Pectobacterium brasiliense TaxID=180957 RepID=UPI0019695C2C|nr:F-type conjugal transfer protein TrbB [Pectobacterium brasiliense]MBN3262949.1 F-type conjugal transfer protein TrbB [Pectobacterium brasiliense]